MIVNKNLKQVIGAVALLFSILAYSKSVAAKEPAQYSKQKFNSVKKKPHIVFLITDDSNSYEAHKTIPVFAALLEKKYNYETTVLLGKGANGAYTYPGFDVVAKADLLVIFARRIALPHEQMKMIKNHLSKSKPIIGIRTANHAFTVREKVQDGFEDWPAFVADILGCENRGYGPVEPGTDVSVVPAMTNHPIIKNLPSQQWHSNGNVYLVAPLLDANATVLLTGKVNDIVQPIAWTRMADKSKVFYTSLGYPDDFKTETFFTLLTEGIKWALNKSEQ